MNAKKSTMYAVFALALFVGMNISGYISEASASCWCPASCRTDCEYDPIWISKQCNQVYNQAQIDMISGIGLMTPFKCGFESVGYLCLTVGGSCGGDSYTNGSCV